jgi:aspartate kinase
MRGFLLEKIMKTADHERSLVVAKAGGDNMADAANIRKFANILIGDPSIRHVVVSAPGRRFDGDTKVTDLLIQSSSDAVSPSRFDETFSKVASRYRDISAELYGKDWRSPALDLSESFYTVRKTILRARERIDGSYEKDAEKERTRAEGIAASRGESLQQQVVFNYLKYLGLDVHEVDPTRFMRIDDDNLPLSESSALAGQVLSRYEGITVSGGFYGTGEDGDINVLGRGGSDTTSTYIAKGRGADAVVMFKQFDGVYAADPRIVPHARPIPEITFDESGEALFRGFDVVARDAVAPAADAGIPIIIKSFDEPDKQGTQLVVARESAKNESVICVAGRDNYAAVVVHKDGMNRDKGMLKGILNVFDRHTTSVDHNPTITDASATIFDKRQLNGAYDETMQQIEADIAAEIRPDGYTVYDDVAVLTIVGQNLADGHTNAKVSTQVFGALSRNEIPLVAQSSIPHGNNLVIAVPGENFEDAITAVHDATVHNRSRWRKIRSAIGV